MENQYNDKLICLTSQELKQRVHTAVLTACNIWNTGEDNVNYGGHMLDIVEIITQTITGEEENCRLQNLVTPIDVQEDDNAVDCLRRELALVGSEDAHKLPCTVYSAVHEALECSGYAIIKHKIIAD